MSGFNMDGYVDVAERIGLFAAKYPEGSLQAHTDLIREGDKIVGVLCVAEAYRTPDDVRPGVGTAYEPIPGKTPYTKDSEVMNAETSAWGRAIVALGFETKKVASADEVRNRTGDPHPEMQRTEVKEPKSIRETAEEFAANAGMDFWGVFTEVYSDTHPGARINKDKLSREQAKAVCEEIAKRKKAK